MCIERRGGEGIDLTWLFHFCWQVILFETDLDLLENQRDRHNHQWPNKWDIDQIGYPYLSDGTHSWPKWATITVSGVVGLILVRNEPSICIICHHCSGIRSIRNEEDIRRKTDEINTNRTCQYGLGIKVAKVPPNWTNLNWNHYIGQTSDKCDMTLSMCVCRVRWWLGAQRWTLLICVFVPFFIWAKQQLDISVVTGSITFTIHNRNSRREKIVICGE